MLTLYADNPLYAISLPSFVGLRVCKAGAGAERAFRGGDGSSGVPMFPELLANLGFEDELDDTILQVLLNVDET